MRLLRGTVNLMKPFFGLLLATGLTLALSSTSADTLLIDALSQAPANSPSGLPRPVHGDTMDSVYRRFGSPVEELSAIGDPPITRWVYDKFTVYFEYNKVIRSAVHLDPKK